VRSAAWNSRTALFVVGTNNDTRGASVAIFESDHAAGSAPSEQTEYRCTNCPAGGPSELLVFPRRCIGRIEDGTATTDQIWIDDDDRISALVAEALGRGGLG
jgi:hypothetical protein